MKKYQVTLLLLSAALAGCGRTQAQAPALQNRAGAAPAGIRAFDRLNSLNRQRERAVAQAVEAVPGVEEASVSITDDNALIGLALTQTAGLSDKDLIALKQAAEQAAKEEDAGITHAAVTVIPELKRRIADLSGDGELEGTPRPMASEDLQKMEEFMTK